MALEFTGDSDRLIVNDASFLVGLSAFTFTTWVKCNATLPYDIGFFKTNSTWVSDNGIGIRYDAAGLNGGGTPQVLKCGITINNTECNTETSAYSQTNNWQFICMTWESGTEIDIYLDGVFDIPSAPSGIQTGTTGPTNIDLIYFGTGAKGSTTTGWNGLMEDVRFYSRRLSDAEIQTMYHVKGNDNIFQNLLFRVLFNELPIGSIATSSSVIDLTGNLEIDSIAGTPTYTESPGFSSRRGTRN